MNLVCSTSVIIMDEVAIAIITITTIVIVVTKVIATVAPLLLYVLSLAFPLPSSLQLSYPQGATEESYLLFVSLTLTRISLVNFSFLKPIILTSCCPAGAVYVTGYC